MEPSSTSSSEPARPDRTAPTLGLAFLGVIAVALVRPPVYRDSASQYPYWTLKKHRRAVCTAVLAGNSRVFMNLSPSEMATRLPGHVIYNYGFAACGFSDDYLDAVEATLRPGPGERLIVLGLSPGTLTRKAAEENGFVATERGPLWEVALRWKARRWLERLDPLLRHLRERVEQAPIRDTFVFHDDGWVAATPWPWRPGFTAPRVEAHFRRSRPDPGRIEAVLDRVRAWSAAGIRVVGFHPPSNAATAAAEDRHSDLDLRAFAARFREAGGAWIDVDRDGYSCYDGLHLTEAGARAFSRDLAGAIAAALRSD